MIPYIIRGSRSKEEETDYEVRSETVRRSSWILLQGGARAVRNTRAKDTCLREQLEAEF